MSPGRLVWRASFRRVFSEPRVFVASVVTIVVACFLGASSVFHVAASGSAALSYEAGLVCPDSFGPVFSKARVSAAKVPALTAVVTRHAAQFGFGAANTAMFTGAATARFGSTSLPVRFGYVDGALEHLDVVRSHPGQGLLVGEHLATVTGADLGQTGDAGLLPAISGIYADLPDPAPRWWCSQRGLAVRNLNSDRADSADVAFFTNRAAFESLTIPHAVVLDRLTISFDTPPPDTIESADHLRQRSAGLIAAVKQDLAGQGLAASLDSSTPFDRSTQIAHQAEGNLAAAVFPLAAVSVLIAFCAVAAAALQWHSRRGAEIRLHLARGERPLTIGMLAGAETALPFLCSGVGAALLARVAVPYYAPSGSIGPAAMTTGFAVAAAVLVVATLVLVVTVSARCRQDLARRSAKPPGPRANVRLTWIPFELVTGGVAVAGWDTLRDYGASSGTLNPLPVMHPLAVAYPVAAVLTAGLIIARLCRVAVASTRRVALWRWPVAQLALRRIASGSGPIVAVAAVGVLAVATLTVGHAIAGSQRDALERKADMFVGANSRVDTETVVGAVPEKLPNELRPISTLTGQLTGTGSVVLVVDPATFPTAAAQAGLPADDLRDRLRQLDKPLTDGRLPALRIGHQPTQSTALPGLADAVPVGDLEAFPLIGSAPGYVISRNALSHEQIESIPRWSLLSQAPLEQVTAALSQAGLSYFNTASTATAFDALPFYLVVWGFSYVEILGTILAIIGVVALLVTIEIRGKQNLLSGIFTRRMGMSVSRLYLSHLVEIALLATVSLTSGLATGVVVGDLAAPGFDPARWLAPRTEFPPIGAFIGVTTLISALTTVVIAAVALRRIVTVKPAELLRA